MSHRVGDHGQAPSPLPVSAAPSMFGPNTTFGNTRETDFNHSSGNTYYDKVVLNFFTSAAPKCGDGDDSLGVPDVINTLNSALPPLIEEIRKIKSQHNLKIDSTLPQAIREPNTMVDEIVPPSIPTTSIADKYSRTMLKCLAGYPLYKPDPYNNLNVVSAGNHSHEGIRVGDVGFIRENGAFDLLFNICPSHGDSSNPPELPINFTLQGSENLEIYKEKEFPHTSRLFNPPVYRAKDLFRHTKYRCSESEGAILELPKGATRTEAKNRLSCKTLAMRCGVEWYRYTMSQGKYITNGSLYLVTSSTKCTHWGIAVVQQPCPSRGGLRFVHNTRFSRDQTRKYHWKGSSTFTTTMTAPILDPNHETALNQCVFLRGFKIRLRGDIWDGLINEWRSEKPNTIMSSPHTDQGRAPVHPSDLINAAVLSQEPGAKIVITHDDEWRDLFREISTSPKPLDFAKIAQSFIKLIDNNSDISFKKSQRNLTLNGINVHALANSTQKTLKYLAPFCRLRSFGQVQDAALINKIVVKIKNLMDGIDSSMLAAQVALTLADEALQLAEPTMSLTDQESNMGPGRAIEGLENLAGIATLGENYAQQSETIFKNIVQDLHEVTTMTKDKRDVIVIITPDPEQPDNIIKKSLHDVGLELHANLNLFTNFSQQVSALANWLALIRQEISVEASQNTDQEAHHASPTSPGAMTPLPMLDVGVWTKVQVDYHSYFRTIRQVQSHYRSLVSTSFEAWQLSAKSIPFSSGDGTDSDHSTSHSPPAPTTSPLPKSNQTSPRTNQSSSPKNPHTKNGLLRPFLTSLSPRPELKDHYPTPASEKKGKGKEKEKRK